jgi:hypothetical protein
MAVDPMMTRRLLLFMAVGALAAALHLSGAGFARADVVYSIDYSDDPVFMREFFRGVNHVAMKYGTGPIYVTTGPLPPLVVARAYANGTVVVSKAASTNPEQAYATLSYSLSTGFHRTGPQCSAGELYGVHEAAHILDYRTGLSAPQEVVATYGDGAALRGQLGEYAFSAPGGALDPAEALAEAFQTVECGGAATAAEFELHKMLTT